MIKKIFSAILAVIITVSLISCEEDMVYSHCEIVLPLEQEYVEVENTIYDKVYTNETYVVTITRISFAAGLNEGIPETLSLPQFAEYYLKKCNREANIIKGEIVYCEYYVTENGIEHFYLESFYRSPYAYFIVLFASHSSLENEARNDFIEYAKNVKFVY